MQIRQRVVSIIQQPNPLPKLFDLLKEYPNQTTNTIPVKEAILYMMESNHDWQSIARLLRVWTTLKSWALGFTNRMRGRVGEPSLNEDLELNQLLEEIGRLTTIFRRKSNRRLVTISYERQVQQCLHFEELRQPVFRFTIQQPPANNQKKTIAAGGTGEPESIISTLELKSSIVPKPRNPDALITNQLRREVFKKDIGASSQSQKIMMKPDDQISNSSHDSYSKRSVSSIGNNDNLAARQQTPQDDKYRQAKLEFKPVVKNPPVAAPTVSAPVPAAHPTPVRTINPVVMPSNESKANSQEIDNMFKFLDNMPQAPVIRKAVLEKQNQEDLNCSFNVSPPEAANKGPKNNQNVEKVPSSKLSLPPFPQKQTPKVIYQLQFEENDLSGFQKNTNNKTNRKGKELLEFAFDSQASSQKNLHKTDRFQDTKKYLHVDVFSRLNNCLFGEGSNASASLGLK